LSAKWYFKGGRKEAKERRPTGKREVGSHDVESGG
jgi:hypothetical protein